MDDTYDQTKENENQISAINLNNSASIEIYHNTQTKSIEYTGESSIERIPPAHDDIHLVKNQGPHVPNRNDKSPKQNDDA